MYVFQLRVVVCASLCALSHTTSGGGSLTNGFLHPDQRQFSLSSSALSGLAASLLELSESEFPEKLNARADGSHESSFLETGTTQNAVAASGTHNSATTEGYWGADVEYFAPRRFPVKAAANAPGPPAGIPAKATPSPRRSGLSPDAVSADASSTPGPTFPWLQDLAAKEKLSPADVAAKERASTIDVASAMHASEELVNSSLADVQKPQQAESALQAPTLNLASEADSYLNVWIRAVKSGSKSMPWLLMPATGLASTNIRKLHEAYMVATHNHLNDDAEKILAWTKQVSPPLAESLNPRTKDEAKVKAALQQAEKAVKASLEEVKSEKAKVQQRVNRLMEHAHWVGATAGITENTKRQVHEVLKLTGMDIIEATARTDFEKMLIPRIVEDERNLLGAAAKTAEDHLNSLISEVRSLEVRIHGKEVPKEVHASVRRALSTSVAAKEVIHHARDLPSEPHARAEHLEFFHGQLQDQSSRLVEILEQITALRVAWDNGLLQRATALAQQRATVLQEQMTQLKESIRQRQQKLLYHIRLVQNTTGASDLVLNQAQEALALTQMSLDGKGRKEIAPLSPQIHEMERSLLDYTIKSTNERQKELVDLVKEVQRHLSAQADIQTVRAWLKQALDESSKAKRLLVQAHEVLKEDGASGSKGPSIDEIHTSLKEQTEALIGHWDKLTHWENNLKIVSQVQAKKHLVSLTELKARVKLWHSKLADHAQLVKNTPWISKAAKHQAEEILKLHKFDVDNKDRAALNSLLEGKGSVDEAETRLLEAARQSLVGHHKEIITRVSQLENVIAGQDDAAELNSAVQVALDEIASSQELASKLEPQHLPKQLDARARHFETNHPKLRDGSTALLEIWGKLSSAEMIWQNSKAKQKQEENKKDHP